jgi:hypothetical protein
MSQSFAYSFHFAADASLVFQATLVVCFLNDTAINADCIIAIYPAIKFRYWFVLFAVAFTFAIHWFILSRVNGLRLKPVCLRLRHVKLLWIVICSRR